ncbi:glycosyl transferase family 2 [Flavobacterium noncentrifugens]|uniref:Glycosyl transferase family group 2 n=1 Tax=Flavobacterium noncentrifugens TaxID=1128970 RepID=A0A1G8WCF4_9FLAO|nr:glycosyltransferase [Flavobacterium noncentrifugens]GEP50866.1 glycosyl transferase family 2 [Flavobacterium noncentrifugens]SDJ75979.1 Glycosyl transferase family group 2 [Flavobacterium noncentrifugens]
MRYSLIIPVYNRPNEVDELLESLSELEFSDGFEVVIVEDGSFERCDHIIEKHNSNLKISYYYKENSGPGDSRNFGMKKAKGDYFLIFDSDCIIPKKYLNEVDQALRSRFVDCFGGPDQALDSFSDVQKAINFAMTSFITTGGIRGGSEKIDKFQPRSFNMGISKKAFDASGGFGNIHPGEDPDLSMRLWNLGFETALFHKAYVYHKRRIDWNKFSIQVNKFGKARPILNSWYPKFSKLTYFVPTGFILMFFAAIVLLAFGQIIGIFSFAVYFFAVFFVSSYQNKNFKIGYLSVIAVWKQFYGYGTGFLKSFILIQVLKKNPQQAFPELFFKK